MAQKVLGESEMSFVKVPLCVTFCQSNLNPESYFKKVLREFWEMEILSHLLSTSSYRSMRFRSLIQASRSSIDFFLPSICLPVH